GPDPNNPKSHPKKLDHFVFKRKSINAKNIVWEEDAHLMEIFGANPVEIGIILLDDDPDNVFRTSYAWWTQTECKCRGEMVQLEDGAWAMQATRKTEKHPDGEPWPGNYRYKGGDKDGQAVEGCGDGCPDLERGDCKPSGDLYFVLDKFPTFGAVCRLHTTSYRSIRQISSALLQVQKITGGRLAGIRTMLKVRPEKGTYTDASGKHTTTLYILSLEVDAQDWKKLLASMTETSALFERTRKLLGGGRLEIVEDDGERAPEIAGEFHPRSEIVDEAPPAMRSVQRKSERENPPAQEAAPPGPPRSELPAAIERYESARQQTTAPQAPAASQVPFAVNGNCITEKQLKRFMAICHDTGWTEAEIKVVLREKWNIESRTHILKSQYDAICAYFESPSPEGA
ncbi:MAG: hypothetical protein ACRD2O_08965, partial [Terriglobia bacterium]